jgi:hypothetical protein
MPQGSSKNLCLKDEPLAPIEHGPSRAVPSSHLGGIGLDPMLASLTPNDQPHAGGGGIAEGHRWAGMDFTLT